MTKENLKECIDFLPEDLYKDIVGTIIVGSDGCKSLTSRYFVDNNYQQDGYVDKYGNYPKYVTMVETICAVVHLGATISGVEITDEESTEIARKIEKTILNELLRKK
jgi:hypothetical protein